MISVVKNPDSVLCGNNLRENVTAEITEDTESPRFFSMISVRSVVKTQKESHHGEHGVHRDEDIISIHSTPLFSVLSVSSVVKTPPVWTGTR